MNGPLRRLKSQQPQPNPHPKWAKSFILEEGMGVVGGCMGGEWEGGRGRGRGRGDTVARARCERTIKRTAIAAGGHC